MITITDWKIEYPQHQNIVTVDGISRAVTFQNTGAIVTMSFCVSDEVLTQKKLYRAIGCELLGISLEEIKQKFPERFI